MRSEKYELIWGYYKKGYWPKKWVHNAVIHPDATAGWITAEEYKLITGEDYIPN